MKANSKQSKHTFSSFNAFLEPNVKEREKVKVKKKRKNVWK